MNGIFEPIDTFNELNKEVPIYPEVKMDIQSPGGVFTSFLDISFSTYVRKKAEDGFYYLWYVTSVHRIGGAELDYYKKMQLKYLASVQSKLISSFCKECV